MKPFVVIAGVVCAAGRNFHTACWNNTAATMKSPVRFGSNPCKLVVFDLDMTLWPFRLDKHMKSPFSTTNDMKVVDLSGQEVNLMNDSLSCLEYLKAQGYQIGIASRIKDISGAYQLINLLGIAPYFDYREIYPGCKKRHFHSLQQKSNLDYEAMVFFDDDWRNIRDVASLGVTVIHVPEGITEPVVRTSVQS